MKNKKVLAIVCISSLLALSANAQDAGMQKWVKGKGWGWVWGSADEVGALNEMTDASRLAALGAVTEGKVYDLGVHIDRNSYQWVGHSPLEIMNFRTPHGILTQKDYDWMQPEAGNTSRTTWRSQAIFMSDNAGTNLDGLSHVPSGPEDTFYNGYKTGEWDGDFGIRKADVTTIPPIIANGVLIDVATYKGVSALESGYEITVDDLKGALAQQGTTILPGSVVLVRTGAMGAWGETGADHEALEKYTLSGVGLPAAKWLVEEQGAMLVGADNEGFEVYPSKVAGSTDPVHVYLLNEQGVHIMEFMNLEGLSAGKVYNFAFVLNTNAIRGVATAPALRPIAIR